MATPVWTDDPRGLAGVIPAINEPVIGSSSNPVGKIFVRDITVIGTETVSGNEAITGSLAVGTTLAVTGAATVGGTLGVTGAVTGASFLLADASDKNYQVVAQGAGTAYALTNTAAAIDLGTTDPAIVLNKAGTYLIFGRVNLRYTAATFAASRLVTLKIRRTNNTPADLTGGTTTLATDIITTLTYTMGVFSTPPILYTTAVLTDAITIFADVAVVPSAGTLDAVEASIVAIRLS